MIMDVLPPPGLEHVAPLASLATPSHPYTSSRCIRDEWSSWRLGQENAELIRQNAELKAQITLISKNTALAQANVRLVEQLRFLNGNGRKSEVRPEQKKANAHLDISSDAASTCAASTCGYISESDGSDADGKIGDRRLMTAMMRNIPSTYTRANLLELLDQQGFLGSYDLLYLPVEFQTELNHGYAFINFTSTENFERFSEHFTGFSAWMVPSDRICEVSWSDAAQGIDENVQRYRDSPLMHESVEDRFKPAVFENGLRVPFPEPTKKIKPPRRKKCLVANLELSQ